MTISMVSPVVTAPSAVSPKPTTYDKTFWIRVSVCGCIFLVPLAIISFGLGVRFGNSNRADSFRDGISSMVNYSFSGEGADTGNFSVLSPPIVNCTYTGSSSCGCFPKKPSFLLPRIVQGYTAVANSWPWMVAIFVHYSNSYSFCGGFLVTYQHVLTAAHCVHKKRTHLITVYAGIQKLSDRIYGQSRRVSAIHIHPDYTSNLTNDIAVITLESAFSETSTVGKCCLTFNTSLPSVGEHAVITGWGMTSNASRALPNNLLQGVIQIQNSSVCNITSNTALCAAYAGTDACFGDSGGPLMTSVNNAWTCTGVISATIAVNETLCGALGIYTKVSAYQSFINNIISDLN